MGRPRLLFLSHILPEPQDSGAAIRTHHTLRILASRYDVTALCFWRPTPHGPSSADDRAGRLARYGDIVPFPVPARFSRLRRLGDHVKSVATRTSWVSHLYESTAFRRHLEQRLGRERFELVHVESLDLVAYLELVEQLPCVCAHHNVESVLMARRAEGERSPWARPYIRWQARLIRRDEERWCPRMRLNVAVSEEDRRQLEEIAPTGAYRVFPNGVDVDHYRPRDGGSSEGLAFVGGINWYPNRDALEYFSTDVLPELRRRGERPAVRWIGHATPDDKRRFARHGVTLTGFVEDERPLVQGARCFVVPLRIGGGTRLKILNAWAMGKAVVSTSTGCEGLETRDGENILIADDPASFAEAIQRVLRDDDLRERLESGGRATAIECYGWDVIGARMLDAYRALEAHR